jgi:hypothetical protein
MQTNRACVPSLINSPGLTRIGGVPVARHMPLRNQPPVNNTVAGAMAIQEFIGLLEELNYIT